MFWILPKFDTLMTNLPPLLENGHRLGELHRMKGLAVNLGVHPVRLNMLFLMLSAGDRLAQLGIPMEAQPVAPGYQEPRLLRHLPDHLHQAKHHIQELMPFLHKQKNSNSNNLLTNSNHSSKRSNIHTSKCSSKHSSTNNSRHPESLIEVFLLPQITLGPLRKIDSTAEIHQFMVVIEEHGNPAQ